VPFGAADVVVRRIGNTFNRVVSMPRTDVFRSLSATTSGGELSLAFSTLPAGDAYWLEIDPR
jgi:hypothetical protein